MARHRQTEEYRVMGIRLDYILAALLLIGVAAYATTKAQVFGFFSLVVLVVLFLKDALPSSSDSKSIRTSLFELGIALGAALFLWYGLGFVLQTPTPIDVVTSCSMFPALDRGDLIVLQGGEINAKEVAVPKSIEIRDFIATDCKVKELGTDVESDSKCVTGVKVDNLVYNFDKSGDMVVYEPKNALRSIGLIVHRVVLKLKYNNDVYYLIKGDNNKEPDLLGLITMAPTKREDIKGKVILRIPWVGYLKLFLSLQFENPPNCKYLVEQ